jgi:cyclase
VFHAGADKISVNSPALERPELINELAETFGSQAVVVGIDSTLREDDYRIWQYTGSETTARETGRRTRDWMIEAQARGAGEIVLNCMNADGTRSGYDLTQLTAMREICEVPLIASGGAGCIEDFKNVFEKAGVDGALAASIFHRREIAIPELKKSLAAQGIALRL